MSSYADECLDQAKDSIVFAIKKLSEIIVDRCEGTEDYKPEYRTILRENLNRLIEIRESFGY